MLGTIIAHVKSLLERQQQLSNKENNFGNDYIVRSHKYKPVLDGQFAREEIKARKVLAYISHQTYFVKQLKSSDYLQIFYNTNDSAHNIWPANELFDVLKKEHVTIKVGSRCSC